MIIGGFIRVKNAVPPRHKIDGRWLPGAFIFVLILRIIAACVAIVNEGNSPMAVLQVSRDGFWSLLEFSMYMLLIS